MAMSRNVIAGLVLLALAVVYWLGADVIPRSPLSGTVGADGLPKLLAVILGTLACILVVQSILLPQRDGAETTSSPEAAAERRRLHLRALGMLALGIGYVAIIETAGYLVSVALLIAATAVYNGRRPSLGLASVVVVAAAVFYVLFVRVLNVPLPAGIWPELLRRVG